MNEKSPSTQPPGGKIRLLPREHGAYAQIGFPLATGLALAVPSATTLLLAVAAVLFFLANEPVAILLGARGTRLRDRGAREAPRRAMVLLTLGTLAGGLGVILGWPHLWPEILLPALPALGLVPMVLVGRQKTLPGEFLVFTSSSALILPLLAPSGVSPLRAALAAGVWWLSFALGTLQVHAIKARGMRTAPRRWTGRVSPVASGGVLLGALWLALGQASPLLDGSPLTRLLPPAAAALLPPALAIFTLSLLKVHPRHLKRVGWTLVGANALTLLLLLQG